MSDFNKPMESNIAEEEKEAPVLTCTETKILVESLEVSKPSQAEIGTVLQEPKADNEEESDSVTETEDEGDHHKVLGFVISELQSTVEQNKEKRTSLVQQHIAENDSEFHSRESEDVDSEPRSSYGDDENNSTSTSSTNFSQHEREGEKDKMVESFTDIVSAIVVNKNITLGVTPDTEENEDDKEKANTRYTISIAGIDTGTKVSIPQVFEEIVPPTPGIAPQRQIFDFGGRTSEDARNIENRFANLIALNKTDLKGIKANTLEPREQETADEPVLRAISHLFNNRFMKAKTLFEKQAETDPLHALGLGSMAFLKAIMTMDESASKNAIDVLTTAYNIATAQINATTKNRVGGSVYRVMSSYINHVKFARGTGGLPSSPKPATKKSIQRKGANFISNGDLRAHVAKAECCLQIAILQLLQENVMGYIKCGVNLRRAYTSYSLVWQEYKRMGQVYNEYIDRDTISGIQFGIGAVHLVLSTLPQKVLRVVSAFGWKADKHLGFALLKLCLEERRIRSPMASLMLLAYYTILTSLCPQILSNEYTQPAIETLLDARKAYPNSAFFLYFAGRTSRLAHNLPLSTQSFTYAIEISKKEWAEVDVLHACSYEIGLNHMMEHNWEEAANVFDKLFKEKYWSPAIFRYLTGACLDMIGRRTEAILAYAEVPQLCGSKSHSTALMEKYVLRKVTAFEDCGYQDLDMSLCALEYLYVFAGFDFMGTGFLEKSLASADYGLDQIKEAENTELSIRTRELLPGTPAPKYFDQRGALLLIKASILNTMGRYGEAIIHLNWIIDHKDVFEVDKWIVPYAFWEAGITSWNMDRKVRSRSLWESALKLNKYDFEYRLAMKVTLAITKADEMDVPKPEHPNPAIRHQNNKKEPIIELDFIESHPPSLDENDPRLVTADLLCRVIASPATSTAFKVHI